MATQAENQQTHQKSEFHQYLDNNQQMVDQMMRIIVNLYMDPKKVSETPELQDELVALELEVRVSQQEFLNMLIMLWMQLEQIKEETL
ncbi:UNKNOWN [Stylonychia lemnae]|uniref:Uncharacterized protein n=1 Tax=Stylonychia lemnae TaxID=5949 RepID=A0A078ANM5_STYLE|nr:UNKNOWN [Stylonychia lemnae]|eukprot:CDW82568.1 UNKNOWN [Stylonychia lemnae]